jgi:hypothetical protein
MGRRAAVVLGALVLGVAAFLLVDRPWAGMSSAQAARLLEQRLGSPRDARAIGLSRPITDRYTCTADNGPAVSREPDWTFDCVDAVRPQESGFFVLTRGDRIAQIQPSG